MPVSSTMKNLRRRGQVLNESSDEDNSDDNSKILSSPVMDKATSKNLSTSPSSTVPSSTGSGAASSSFRLNCRIPKSSTTKSKVSRPSTRTQQQPQKGSFGLGSLSSSSDSDDMSSIAPPPKNSKPRRPTSRRSDDDSDKKMPPQKQRPDKKRTAASYSLTSSSTSSDSDDSDSSVEVVEGPSSKTPATKQPLQSQPLAQQQGTPKRLRGIDPSFINNQDSDSDDSLLQPAASLTILHTTRPSSKSQSLPKQPQPIIIKKFVRKPLAVVQPLIRKPPIQPTRNDRTKASQVECKPSKRFNDNLDSGSSSSSDESANLRHVARKCEAQKAAQKSPLTSSPSKLLLADDPSVSSTMMGNPTFEEETEEQHNQTNVTAYDNDSVSTAQLEERVKRLMATRGSLRDNGNGNNNGIDAAKKKTASTLWIEATNQSSQTAKREMLEATKDIKTALDGEHLSDNDSDCSDDEFKNNGHISSHKEDGNETDADSVDTVELNRRLRKNLGLPVLESEQLQAKPLPAHRQQLPPPKDYFQSPSTGKAANKSSNAQVENRNVDVSKQDLTNEFVLPDCESSSSSSSSCSDHQNDGQERSSSQGRHHPIASIPSSITVARSGPDAAKQPYVANQYYPESSVEQQSMYAADRRGEPSQQGAGRVSLENPSFTNDLHFAITPAHSAFREVFNPPHRHPTIARENAARQNRSFVNPYTKKTAAKSVVANVESSRASDGTNQALLQSSALKRHEKQQQQQHNSPTDSQGAIRNQAASTNKYNANGSPDDAVFFQEDNNSVTFDTSGGNIANESPTPVNACAHAGPARNDVRHKSIEQLETEVFFPYEGEQPTAKAPKRPRAVVDLCQDDDDFIFNDDYAPVSNTIVHQGLRVPVSSPEFNRRARERIGTGRKGRSSSDDIKEFSDDNAEPFTRVARPRRVTDVTTSNHRQLYSPAKKAKLQPTMSSASYDANTSSGRTTNAGASRFSAVAASSRSEQSQRPNLPYPRPDLPNQWVQQRAKRVQVRDACNSDPFLARSVVRKHQRQQELRPTNDENVFYRQNSIRAYSGPPSRQQPPQQQQTMDQFFPRHPLRNDLAGGSGVGAGSYSLQHSRKDGDDDISNYEDDYDQHVRRPSSRGRRRGGANAGRTKSRRPSSKAKSGKTSKRGKSKSRGGWGGRRGGSKRGSARGGRRGGQSQGSVMESESDPLLQHVGGADITF